MADIAEIRFDKAKLDDLERMLGGFPKGFPRVVSRALNRAAMTFRSRVTHSAAGALGIPLRAAKAEVYQNPRANVNHLSTTVRIRNRGINLANLAVNREAVRRRAAAAKRHGEKTSLRGIVVRDEEGRERGQAWLARLRPTQKYLGAYVRVGRKRFPVRSQRTAGVVETLKRAGEWDRHYNDILADLERRLMAETEFILKGGDWTAVTSHLGQTWAEWRSEMGGEEFR
ncbi:MAG TPA: hypothetical protein VFH53_07295 [Phycisphaerae bacterium]|nr:hypothetical protein [Phycisphaerae bacterium]HUX14881.1 hypothetical protein [Phycisphaerae bacterium]